MRNTMRIFMILVVVGLIFSLVGEAFARDRYSRSRHNRWDNNRWDRGPNYSDDLRLIAQEAIAVGAEVVIGTTLNALTGNCGGSPCGGGSMVGSYDPVVQGQNEALVDITWEDRRRAKQDRQNRKKILRNIGATQVYRSYGR